MPDKRVILTAQCPDQQGIVAAISGWISSKNGNILHLDQHVDTINNRFFIRAEWDLADFNLSDETIHDTLNRELGQKLELEFTLSFNEHRPRLALFVSKLGHCLWDILSRHESGELQVDIPLIISNHSNYADVAEKFGIPYHVFEITAENKAEMEAAELALLAEHNIDLVVLARYMQVLSDQFVQHYPNRVINIHHSFLPAFAGGKPYHRAYERGVKLIGATAHYVTSELDEGPIIEQDTSRVSHRDTVDDMVRLGRDLEKIVLSRAIYLHLNRQVIVHNNRTLVF